MAISPGRNWRLRTLSARQTVAARTGRAEGKGCEMRGMRSARSSIVGVAVLVAALAAVSPVGAGTPPGGPDPSSSVPDGFQWVEDETQTIGVAVPVDWTVDPVTQVGPPGKLPAAVISASAPGDELDHLFLDVVARPVVGVPEPWDPSTCDPTRQECPSVVSTSAYDDGSFAGYRQTIEGCCASGVFDRVVANAHDGSLAIDVQLNFGSERTPDDVALFETILATVARVGAPMPAVEPPTDLVFPYDDVGDVPQLGNEPVRGTGCGANGQVGETIPDGMWAGFVTVDGDTVGIDLLCIYTAETAQEFVDLSDNVIWADVDSTIVNNNERVRTMPAASDIQLRDALFDSSSGCVEASALLPDVDHSPYAAWVNIEGGAVTWVVWGCDVLDAGAEPSPAPSPVPAPPSDDEASSDEAAALAADCEHAEFMIWEGDMYVGIEFPPEGGPITGAFRESVEASRDFFEYDRTQLRSQLAQDALANHYAVWSGFLEGGTYTAAGFEATVLAGFDAVAPFQQACGLPTATR